MCYLKYCRESVREIQHEGACREINTARGEAECCIYLETLPKCCFPIQMSQGSALSVILYFLSDSVAKGEQRIM